MLQGESIYCHSIAEKILRELRSTTSERKSETPKVSSTLKNQKKIKK